MFLGKHPSDRNQNSFSPDEPNDGARPTASSESDESVLGNEIAEALSQDEEVVNTTPYQTDDYNAESEASDDLLTGEEDDETSGDSVLYGDEIPGAEGGVDDQTQVFAETQNIEFHEVAQADVAAEEARKAEERAVAKVATKKRNDEDILRYDAELDNFRVPLKDDDEPVAEARPRIEMELVGAASDPVRFTNELLERLETAVFRSGRVDADYDYSLRIQDEPEQIKIQRFGASGFERLGLVCVMENSCLRVYGKPLCPYDGMIDINIKATCNSIQKPGWTERLLKGKYEVEPRSVSRPFLINPDPWTLWEEHEPDPSLPYKKKHGISSYGAIPADPDAPLTVLAASLRGRSHAHNALFRDDDYKFLLAQNPGEWSFFAVADGAGSAKFSREGSRVACEQTIKTFSRIFNESKNGREIDEELRKEIQEKTRRGAINNNILLDEDAIKRVKLDQYFYAIVYDVYDGVGSVAKERNESSDAGESVSHKDFSTTLLCAALKRFEATETTPSFWVVASYWVGDGGMAIDRPNGKPYVLTLGEPDGGEFAGQTRFVTMRDQIDPRVVAARVRVAVVQNFKALVLMTDGISDPFFPAEDDLANYTFWERFWSQEMPEHMPGVLDESRTPEDRARALLDGLMFKVKGNHDDRTLLFVFGKDEPANEVEPPEEAAEAQETDVSEENTAATPESSETEKAETTTDVEQTEAPGIITP